MDQRKPFPNDKLALLTSFKPHVFCDSFGTRSTYVIQMLEPSIEIYENGLLPSKFGLDRVVLPAQECRLGYPKGIPSHQSHTYFFFKVRNSYGFRRPCFLSLRLACFSKGSSSLLFPFWYYFHDSPNRSFPFSS